MATRKRSPTPSGPLPSWTTTLPIENRSDWLVTDGNTQEISNTIWAFAKLDHDAPALLAATEKRSDWFVTEGTPQHIANTAWAFARLGYKSPALFASIEK
jgi:hypothetical protein